jgi:hypothetical protein
VKPLTPDPGLLPRASKPQSPEHMVVHEVSTNRLIRKSPASMGAGAWLKTVPVDTGAIRNRG